MLVEALDASGHPLSRSQLARSFEAGEVRIGGRAVKASLRLDTAVEVELRLPRPAPLARAFPEALPLSVVFEDEWLLVVDKAPGMVVHASAGHPRGTLVNAVLHHLGVESDALPVLPGNGELRPGLVHRLDKDTSGVMVLAKSAAIQTALAAQFAKHSIDRRYRAWVRGVPKFSEKRVQTTHARDPNDRRRFAPVRGAKRRAVTYFEVHEVFDGAAELTATLETGRTHQIRMHARHVGHALIADGLYGRPSKHPRVKIAAEELGRHALHAELLGFHHPARDERMRFESPVPADLQAMIEILRAPEDSLDERAPR